MEFSTASNEDSFDGFSNYIPVKFPIRHAYKNKTNPPSVSIYMSYFDWAQSLTKVRKTFKSCGLKLKMCVMYQDSLKSCGLKYDMWNIGVKWLLNKKRDIFYKTD